MSKHFSPFHKLSAHPHAHGLESCLRRGPCLLLPEEAHGFCAQQIQTYFCTPLFPLHLGLCPARPCWSPWMAHAAWMLLVILYASG